MERLKRRIKLYLLCVLNYSILIGSIIGIRYLHDMDLKFEYFITMSSVILFLLLIFVFIEPHHLEKLFSKNPTISLIFVLILRFMPLVKMRIMNIKQYQEIRGARYGRLSQFKNYLSLFIPSIINIMRWSNNISEGIQIRGEK